MKVKEAANKDSSCASNESKIRLKQCSTAEQHGVIYSCSNDNEGKTSSNENEIKICSNDECNVNDLKLTKRRHRSELQSDQLQSIWSSSLKLGRSLSVPRIKKYNSETSHKWPVLPFVKQHHDIIKARDRRKSKMNEQIQDLQKFSKALDLQLETIQVAMNKAQPHLKKEPLVTIGTLISQKDYNGRTHPIEKQGSSYVSHYPLSPMHLFSATKPKEILDASNISTTTAEEIPLPGQHKMDVDTSKNMKGHLECKIYSGFNIKRAFSCSDLTSTRRLAGPDLKPWSSWPSLSQALKDDLEPFIQGEVSASSEGNDINASFNTPRINTDSDNSYTLSEEDHDEFLSVIIGSGNIPDYLRCTYLDHETNKICVGIATDDFNRVENEMKHFSPKLFTNGFILLHKIGDLTHAVIENFNQAVKSTINEDNTAFKSYAGNKLHKIQPGKCVNVLPSSFVKKVTCGEIDYVTDPNQLDPATANYGFATLGAIMKDAESNRLYGITAEHLYSTDCGYKKGNMVTTCDIYKSNNSDCSPTPNRYGISNSHEGHYGPYDNLQNIKKCALDIAVFPIFDDMKDEIFPFFTNANGIVDIKVYTGNAADMKGRKVQHKGATSSEVKGEIIVEKMYMFYKGQLLGYDCFKVAADDTSFAACGDSGSFIISDISQSQNGVAYGVLFFVETNCQPMPGTGKQYESIAWCTRLNYGIDMFKNEVGLSLETIPIADKDSWGRHQEPFHIIRDDITSMDEPGCAKGENYKSVVEYRPVKKESNQSLVESGSDKTVKDLDKSLIEHGSDKKENEQYEVGHASDRRVNDQYVVGHGSDRRENDQYVVGDGSDSRQNDQYVVGHGSDSMENGQYVAVHGSDRRENDQYVVGHSSVKKENEQPVIEPDSVKIDISADSTNDISERITRQSQNEQDTVPIISSLINSVLTNMDANNINAESTHEQSDKKGKSETHSDSAISLTEGTKMRKDDKEISKNINLKNLPEIAVNTPNNTDKGKDIKKATKSTNTENATHTRNKSPVLSNQEGKLNNNKKKIKHSRSLSFFLVFSEKVKMCQNKERLRSKEEPANLGRKRHYTERRRHHSGRP